MHHRSSLDNNPAISAKLDQLDRILNDPDTELNAARVWALLAEVTGAGLVAQPQI